MGQSTSATFHHWAVICVLYETVTLLVTLFGTLDIRASQILVCVPPLRSPRVVDPLKKVVWEVSSRAEVKGSTQFCNHLTLVNGVSLATAAGKGSRSPVIDQAILWLPDQSRPHSRGSYVREQVCPHKRRWDALLDLLLCSHPSLGLRVIEMVFGLNGGRWQ